eukprot:332581-Rhodomonas_salina.4
MGWSMGMKKKWSAGEEQGDDVKPENGVTPEHLMEEDVTTGGSGQQGEQHRGQLREAEKREGGQEQEDESERGKKEAEDKPVEKRVMTPGRKEESGEGATVKGGRDLIWICWRRFFLSFFCDG